MCRKAHFIVGCIFGKMLRSEKWVGHHQEVFKAVIAVLRALIPIAKKYPHKPKNSMDTLIHFQVKSFLCNMSLWTWCDMISKDGIHDKKPSLVAFPIDVFVPTLRRLGMMDLLDEDWNMYGSWDQILDNIAQIGDVPLSRVNADVVLTEKSNFWKKARNSSCCRRMSRNTASGNLPHSAFSILASAP